MSAPTDSYRTGERWLRAAETEYALGEFGKANAAAAIAAGHFAAARVLSSEDPPEPTRITATVVQPATRRAVTPALLREVADVYREHVRLGLPPTKSVAARFATTRTTAARWVREARKGGFLRPSVGTVAGERGVA